MDNIIGKRINATLAEKDIKQKELAKKIGVSNNVISYWCSGSRTPNTQQIIQICNALGVSADYLLGLTDVATTDKDLQYICDYTGLDEKAVKLLQNATKGADAFFEQPTKEYAKLIQEQRKAINGFFKSVYFVDLVECFSKQQSVNQKVNDTLTHIKNGENEKAKHYLYGTAINNNLKDEQDLNIYRAQTAILDYLRKLQTYTQDDFSFISTYYFEKGIEDYFAGKNPQKEKGENDE